MEKINPTKDTAQAQLQAIISRVKPAAEQLPAVGPAGLAADPSDQVDEVLYKDIRIVESLADNTLKLFLKGIPPHKIRTYLRRHSFTWCAKEGCWQRDRSPVAMFYAQKAIDKMKMLSATV